MTGTSDTQGNTDKTRRLVMLIYLLYFIGLPTVGLTSIAGVILAHIKKNEVDPPWCSHLEFQIRTFWLAIAIAIVGSILVLVGIGIIILWLIPLWIIIRCVKGFITANNGRAVLDPKTMLW